MIEYINIFYQNSKTLETEDTYVIEKKDSLLLSVIFGAHWRVRYGYLLLN
jgi:hypothetical protein